MLNPYQDTEKEKLTNPHSCNEKQAFLHYRSNMDLHWDNLLQIQISNLKFKT